MNEGDEVLLNVLLLDRLDVSTAVAAAQSSEGNEPEAEAADDLPRRSNRRWAALGILAGAAIAWWLLVR